MNPHRRLLWGLYAFIGIIAVGIKERLASLEEALEGVKPSQSK